MIPDSITILILFLSGVGFGGYVARHTSSTGMLALKEPNMASRQREKKESKKKIIMEYLTTLPESKITVEDVSQMFSVSRATATKYLEELEAEGKLKKVIAGDTSENFVVYYSKV